MEAASPVAFQVVFQRRTSWQSDAEIRKEDLVDGRDTFFQEIVGSFLEVEDQRSNHDEKQLSESVAKRIEYIDAKNPKRSFTANIRAVSVPTWGMKSRRPRGPDEGASSCVRPNRRPLLRSRRRTTPYWRLS